MIYSAFQHQPSLLSNTEFESLKKVLPPSMRKDLKNRHNALCKLKKKHEEREEIKLSQMLDHETIFRVSYIPMVITNLSWDYADTIILMATQLRIQKVKKLSRSIRELKVDYDRISSPFIIDAYKKSDEDNMFSYEEEVRDLFKLYLVNIECDVRSEYPELSDEYVIFVKSVYICHIVLQSIFSYADLQKNRLETIIGHKIGKIIPTHLLALDKLVLEYVADYPISESFRKQQATYASSLANRMLRIELNEINDLE